MDGVYVDGQFYTGHSLGYAGLFFSLQSIAHRRVAPWMSLLNPAKTRRRSSSTLGHHTVRILIYRRIAGMGLLMSSATATAPKYYVDAMYKHYPGAVWNDTIGFYTLPCDARINISMAFGCVYISRYLAAQSLTGLLLFDSSSVYPMNPIDVTDVQVNEDGSYFCIGIFAPTPDNAGVGE